MIHMSRYLELGGFLMSINDALGLFGQIVEAGIPYVITWRIGIYVVNTLVEWVTGGSNQL